MIKTFVIATVGSRYEGLCTLLKSLERYLRQGWHVGICMQGYTDKQAIDVREYLPTGTEYAIYRHSEMIGAHPAKVEILSGMRSDVWCSLDDDMEIIKQTDYNAMADALMKDRSMGFISGNWARTKALAEQKNIRGAFVPQRIVYTGGGLMFRDDIAEIIRQIPNEQYLFDDCLWSGYAYVLGFSNCRYLGSVAVHGICASGGRLQWLNENKKDKPLPPEWMFNVRRGKGKSGTQNEYLICSETDLTDYAKEMHRVNRR